MIKCCMVFFLSTPVSLSSHDKFNLAKYPENTKPPLWPSIYYMTTIWPSIYYMTTIWHSIYYMTTIWPSIYNEEKILDPNCDPDHQQTFIICSLYYCQNFLKISQDEVQTPIKKNCFNYAYGSIKCTCK